MARSVETRAFTPTIDGLLWKVGRLAQPEGCAVRAAVDDWDRASDAHVFETKDILVFSVFGDRDPVFVGSFVGRPYRDYIFVKHPGADEYILGVWHGDEVTVYYARFPECEIVGGAIKEGGRNVQCFDQVQDLLLCCSFL